MFKLTMFIIGFGLSLVFTPFTANAQDIVFGKQALANGSFDLASEADTIPAHWQKSVMPEGLADVVAESQDGNSFIKIKFHTPEKAFQARVIQPFTVEPGKVYELKFRYKTSIGSDLRADILLTGTGPLYRSYYMPPAKDWTLRQIFFHVPDHVKGNAAIYVQNRSAQTIWYDDLSLRPTNLTAEQIADYQPKITAQSESTEDQLLLPNTVKKQLRFLYHLEAADSQRSKLAVIAKLMTSDGHWLDAQVDQGHVYVQVDDVTPGKNTLYVFVHDKQTQARLANTLLEIERIAGADMAVTNEDLRHPPVFKDVHGIPTFPIGMYGVGRPSEKQLAELRDNGFTTIHNYGFEGDPGDRMARHLKFLDQAQSYGLNVMVGFPRDMAEKKSGLTKLEPWIKQLNDHPANLFYTSDEMHIMRHVSAKQFQAVHQMVHNIDSRKRWLIYDIPDPSFTSHVDGVMLVINDEITAKLTRVRMGDKPIIAVWGQPYFNAAKAPTTQQAAYHVFMPVILGSRGWFFWWYPTLKHHNQEKELLKQRVYENTRLLSQVAPALVSTQPDPQWVKQIKAEGDVHYCVGTLDGKTYILAGVSRDAKQGRLQLPVSMTGDVQVRKGEMTADQKTIELSASEILILEVQAP